MIAWLQAPEPEDPEEALDDLYEPELAWQVWQHMKHTQGDEWKFLPFEGGIMDQPYALWHDLMVLMQVEEIAKDSLKKGL
jgi:hypothetical protein